MYFMIFAQNKILEFFYLSIQIAIPWEFSSMWERQAVSYYSGRRAFCKHVCSKNVTNFICFEMMGINCPYFDKTENLHEKLYDLSASGNSIVGWTFCSG